MRQLSAITDHVVETSQATTGNFHFFPLVMFLHRLQITTNDSIKKAKRNLTNSQVHKSGNRNPGAIAPPHARTYACRANSKPKARQ